MNILGPKMKEEFGLLAKPNDKRMDRQIDGWKDGERTYEWDQYQFI